MQESNLLPVTSHDNAPASGLFPRPAHFWPGMSITGGRWAIQLYLHLIKTCGYQTGAHLPSGKLETEDLNPAILRLA